MTLTATVSPASATGKVTFYDGVTVLGTGTLASGQATLTTALLPSGSRSLKAYYGGDATFAASTSATVAQTVLALPQNGFQAAVNYGVGTSPFSVAVGDFNGDGKADLAVANAHSNNVSVLLGNGDGTFRSAVNYGVGSVPLSVAVGDFNGDGKPDLAVTNWTDSTGYANGYVSVLLGNGDGTFQAAGNSNTGPGPNFLAVGDFNGDGRADLAMTGHTGTYVLLGNGDGTFQAAVSYGTGISPNSVSVGDFNGDGKADLVVADACGCGGNLYVLLGDGQGTFQVTDHYPLGPYSGYVVVADFNGDGKADLAAANGGSNNVAVLLGNGDGTFRATPVNYTVRVNPTGIVAGDFNGDGKADLAEANDGSNNVSVLLGNGDGTFQSAVNYNVGTEPVSVVVGDFNGDGVPDLAVANSTSNNVSILLGNLPPAPPMISVSLSPSSLTLVAGGASQAVTVTLTRTNYTDSVALTLGTLPSGVTATITQPGTGNTGTVTLQASNSASLVSNQAITIAASGTGVTATAALSLTVTAPSSMTISLSPSSLTLVAGGASQAVTVTLTRTNYTGSAALALGTLPSGVTATITQPGTGNSGTITLVASSSATLVSNQAITVTASGTGVASATAAFTLTVSLAASGTVTAGSAQGAPGGGARVPVILALSSGVSVDALSFGLQITPNGAAPALTGALSFTKDSAISQTPSLVDTAAGPNVISIAWLGNLSPALSGTVWLGEVGVSIPAAATDGQTYSVHISAASGGLGTTGVTLAAGANATLTVTARTYLMGDVFPVPSAGGDWNGDGRFDNAGEFGDDTLTVLDLISGLRAVTNVPGFRPLSCTDRYDAIDSFPADTSTTRGGNGTLEVLDLIITLRRVTKVDTSQPRRVTRGLSCPAAAFEALRQQQAEGASTAAPSPGDAAVGVSLEVGEAESLFTGGYRVPVYLRAHDSLLLSSLAWAIGIGGEKEGARLRFTDAGADRPSIVDNGMDNAVAVAWLDGLAVKPDERLLLGYLQIEGEGAAGFDLSWLRVYGIEANAREDGRPVRISSPPRMGARF